MGNASGSNKRPNLFNEKSTSRERILTKKKIGGEGGGANASMQSVNGTPSFNISAFKKQQTLATKPVDSNLLKDFPFLQSMQTQAFDYHNLVAGSLPHTNGGGMNDNSFSEEQKEDSYYQQKQ